MIVRILAFLLLAHLLQACTTDYRDTAVRKTAARKEVPGSVPPQAPAAEPAAEATECVFDTNIYQFTVEALRKPNPQQQYTWDHAQRQAVAPLPGGDTLVLRIGGCSHFSYLASYRTDSARFNQEAYLFRKVQWLARTYFGGGFEQDFPRFIANQQYQLEESAPGFKLYSVADPDTSATNRIFEGFYFKKKGARTEIWIHGYVN
jgi:hypothetical protein